MRITSNYFCAGIVIRNGLVVRAAPILQYMLGWRGERVLSYARHRGWSVDTYDEEKAPQPCGTAALGAGLGRPGSHQPALNLCGGPSTDIASPNARRG